MKVKLLKRVRNDARICWNSIYSISTQCGRICNLGFPASNEDVLGYFCGEDFSFDWSRERKQAFMNRVIHRFWEKRKDRYYAKYRKEPK